MREGGRTTEDGQSREKSLKGGLVGKKHSAGLVAVAVLGVQLQVVVRLRECDVESGQSGPIVVRVGKNKWNAKCHGAKSTLCGSARGRLLC